MRKTNDPPKQKERPLLFKGEMVRAILDGRKTQTRRIVADKRLSPKLTLLELFDFLGGGGRCDSSGDDGLRVSFVSDYERQDDNGRRYKYTGLLVQSEAVPEDGAEEIVCPYGVQGDSLLVREKWRTKKQWDHLAPTALPIYDSALPDCDIDWAATPTHQLHGRWRAAIHLPLRFARIELDLTKVRVERLQDISEQDAIAEGCEMDPEMRPGDAAPLIFPKEQPHPKGGFVGWDDAREWYADLWDSINGAGAWDKNPWVWVISFRRISEASDRPGADSVLERDSSTGVSVPASPIHNAPLSHGSLTGYNDPSSSPAPTDKERMTKDLEEKEA
jgi:hypothetical protein